MNQRKIILCFLLYLFSVVHGSLDLNNVNKNKNNIIDIENENKNTKYLNNGNTKKIHFEPQITTICPNQNEDIENDNRLTINNYMSENGNWNIDPNYTTCLSNKIDILKYCQRIYSNKDINNIVESTHSTQVDVCYVNNGQLQNIDKNVKNGGKCNGEIIKKWIKPYRCLESPFQSDALLVPSPCLFDHIHNASLCINSNEWNNTAYNNCYNKNMYLKSYAVLLPCGISLFTGVEFVCCPNTPDNKLKITNKKYDYSDGDGLDNYDDDDDDEDDDDDDDDDEYDLDRSTTTTTTTTTTPKPTVDPYYQNFNILNEHANYIDAKERLNKLHKNRINNIMNDWNKLEDRYQAMRTNDPIGAEEFKKTVTLRFQKTVKSLEEESMAEKKQLISIHGQRILSHLNEKKREAMECYTKSLNERPQVSRKVRKCLEKLMKYLNKDRHHTILYFKNNLNNEDIFEYTLDRLEQITNTVHESLTMLDRYIHLSAELKPLTEDYILSLQGLNDLKYNSILTSTRDSDTILLNSISGKTVLTTITTMEPSSSSTTPSTTTENKITTEENININSNNNNNKLNELENNDGVKLYRNDHEYNSNIKNDGLEHHESTFTVRREVYYSNENKNVYLIMAFAGFALFGTMVTGLIILRRRNSPRNQGFLEVNTTSSCPVAPDDNAVKSPEEKHVANMQINGYENPTYKYFEIGTIIK